MHEAQAICDASGFKCKLSDLVRQWDGAMVLPQFCDRRNPQDFVTDVRDNEALPYSRPEPTDTFLATNDVTPEDL